MGLAYSFMFMPFDYDDYAIGLLARRIVKGIGVVLETFETD